MSNQFSFQEFRNQHQFDQKHSRKHKKRGNKSHNKRSSMASQNSISQNIFVPFHIIIIISKVAVRLRPLMKREAAESDLEIVHILDQRTISLKDPSQMGKKVFLFCTGHNSVQAKRPNRVKEVQYKFDYAFGEESSQKEVYQHSARFLIDTVLEGYNATIFAYGATGAGKTYTMMGTNSKPGIMFLAMNELFQRISMAKTKKYVIKLSYIQVYNEIIQDLLTQESKTLEIREDPIRGTSVAGCSEIITNSPLEIMAILKIGSKNRAKESTASNVVSSRSHAVLQVLVQHKEDVHGTSEEVNFAKFCLIDLAGSERATNAKNKGKRLREGKLINKSLLTLGSCIQALSQLSEGKRNVHVPYRNSKLTRLLKDSLGGNCKTVMIANISPAGFQYDDTHNTLEYANRAKNIKTTINKNIVNVSYHVAKFGEIIKQLKVENDKLRQQLAGGGGEQKYFNPQSLYYKNENNQAMEQLKIRIRSHFESELYLKKNVFVLEENMEQIGFSLFKALNEKKKSESKSERQKLQKKIKSFKEKNNSLRLEKDDLLQKYNSKKSQRSALQIVNLLLKFLSIQRINSKDFSSQEKSLLQVLFKQQELLIVIFAIFH